MKIVYFSKTNNIKRFCEKIEMPVIRGDEKLVCEEPYVLIIYTTGFGEVPKEVLTFLKNKHNQKNLVAVSGSGNKNWGTNYAKAVDIVSEKYNVEALMKFELSGNVHDVSKFREKFEGLIRNEE